MANFVFALTVLSIYVIVFRYPGVGCGLVFASYAIEQIAQATVPIAAANSPLCNYLTAGAIMVALIAQVRRLGVATFRIYTPGLLVLLLLAYCYATLFWSIVPSATERILRTQIPYLVVFVGFAPMIIQNVENLEQAFLGLIVGGTLTLLSLILIGDWQGRSIMLLNGMPSNPLMLTRAAGSLLVAASLTDIVHKFFPRTWPLVAATIAVTVLLTFLRTGSRGQIVSAVSVCLLFSSTRKGRWWIPFLCVGIAGLLGSGFLAEELERNASRWDTDRLTTEVSEGRLGYARSLLRFWMNSSLSRIVWGLGNGVAQDPRVLGTYPHVVPAEILAEEGLVGFLIYLTVLFVTAWTYMRASALYTKRHKDIVLATAALALYEFLLTLKQGTLFGGPSVLLLFVLSGVLRQTPRSPERVKLST